MSAIRLPAALALVLACGAGARQAERSPLSEAIKVDQVGYLPARAKRAAVTDPRARGPFAVRRSGDAAEVLRGTLGPKVADPDTGDTVMAADFSGLAQEGSFYLEVDGVGSSHEFEVSPDVYVRAFLLAARSFYGQRCGTAVDLGPSHPAYRHPGCHMAGTANPDALFHASSGRGGALDARGGWHDAGDYGKYVVNSGIATGELLWAYELFADRVGSVRLDIPESGNDVPDLLDEIRWNLEWMLVMQDADGGVWHKLTSERFGGFVLPHVDDSGPRYVIGTGSAPHKSSCATADFAAVMAAAARVFRRFDPAFAGAALAAAERAWAWVSANPDVVFRNCCGVQTGEYGDADCRDERLWAAAELYRTTGAAEYDLYFTSHFAGRGAATVTEGPPQWWQDVGNLAMVGYLLAGGPGAGDTVRARIRADTLAAADAIVARSAANPYRVSLRSDDYVWGSNGVVANYGVLLVLANEVRPNAAYLEAAADDLHYLLGRNTFGLSWVTGVGDRPFRHPHHRPSGGDDNAEPWPGLLSGGPNRYGGDPVLDALPEAPPARRYRDDQGSWASNENAINWNAALVFLLASVLPEDGAR